MSNTGEGAVPPPPGVTPDFEHPYTILPAIRGALIFLAVVITISTGLRMYMRFATAKVVSYSSDTMLLAYLCYMAYLAIALHAFNYGAGEHEWDVSMADVAGWAYWSWVLGVFYTPCIALVRLSICLQFTELFVVDRNERFWAIIAFLVFTFAYYASQFFLTIFQCSPIAKAWKPQLAGSCFGSGFQLFIIATGLVNLAGDILMLTFPLYCIWGLQVSWRRRLAIAGLFMVGLLAIAASTLRVTFSFYNYGSLDSTFTLSEVAGCAIGEISAGILVGNLVWLPGFLNEMRAKVKAWIARYSTLRA